MHIPDNYLSPSTCGIFGAIMLPVWYHCIKKVRTELSREKVAFIGIAAAFSFLLMMFNVPLPGGTTGHAVGGTLIAILLGPEAACLAVTVALAIQALLFGDGGILAFGANCFNMAFVLPFAGYAVYRLVAGRDGRRDKAAAAIGAYVGINAAALCTAVEFGIQPALFHDGMGNALFCPYPLSISIPAMMIPHLLVAGVVDAVATVLIYSFVKSQAPEYAYAPAGRRPGCAGVSDGAGMPGGKAQLGAAIDMPADWAGQSQGDVPVHHDASALRPAYILLAALAVATPIGLVAGSSVLPQFGDAWGEWGAQDLAQAVGYTPAGMQGGFEWSALMPDYSLAGLPDAAGYVVSAVIGAALLVIIFKLISTVGQGASKPQSHTA